MSRIRRTSAGSVGSGNGRRGTPAAPRPERSRRRGGSRGRGSKPGGRGGRGADDDLFARSGVGSAPGSNAFVRDRGTSVRRLLMRLRDLRLRAGSRTSQANPVSLGQRPPPSCGIARRRDGRGARVAGRRRERPARGRTRLPAVVPQLARSYPDARGRTLDLPQGTTWHRKVRPREPTYDRATLWATAELGSSRGSSDARLTRPGSDPPPRDASQIVTRTAQRRRADLSVAPSREVPGGVMVVHRERPVGGSPPTGSPAPGCGGVPAGAAIASQAPPRPGDAEAGAGRHAPDRRRAPAPRGPEAGRGSFLSSARAVWTSVIRTLTHFPSTAPRMAACLRLPPAAATRRGMARSCSALAPTTRAS